MQKWIAIIALALMPAVVYANVCATSYDLAMLGATQPIADGEGTPCEKGQCLYANLCDLAKAVFVGHVLATINPQQCSDRVAEALQIAIPAEPRPPLKPPVV